MKKRNEIVRDLRTPKYKMRVVPDKKKKEDKEKCRTKNSVDDLKKPLEE